MENSRKKQANKRISHHIIPIDLSVVAIAELADDLSDLLEVDLWLRGLWSLDLLGLLLLHGFVLHEGGQTGQTGL